MKSLEDTREETAALIGPMAGAFKAEDERRTQVERGEHAPSQLKTTKKEPNHASD